MAIVPITNDNKIILVEQYRAIVWSTLATTYEQLGNLRLAEEAHANAMRVGSGDFDVQNSYAVFLCRQQRYSDAEKQFERSIGLEFYVASGVLERGRAGEGEHVTPVFVDIQMADQYPSVGILETQPGRRTTYRILVSWFEGLAIRDYEVTWVGSASVRVTPRSPKLEACRGLALSTPMLSKDGREIAARDETTGTTKIFRLARNGSCQLVYDIGRQTSKVAFSDDGTLIAYSSPNARSNSTTYVLNRRTRQTRQLPESESRGLVIPEMIGPDSLLLQVTLDSRRRSVEFRLLCCVR